jgi:hypothetical protein
MAEGERQHRTGRQQLEHWARVGRAVSSRQTAARGVTTVALSEDGQLIEYRPDGTHTVLPE